MYSETAQAINLKCGVNIPLSGGVPFDFQTQINFEGMS